MSAKEGKSVYLDFVRTKDGGFFTDERQDSWKVFIAESAERICEEIKGMIDVSQGVDYFLSFTLVNEVIRDAVIGMKKIVEKTPHKIEHPNIFKVAAYLCYWLLRHKPISIIYPNNTDIDEITPVKDCILNDKEISWKLKHINEVVAVDIALSFLFDFEQLVCDDAHCKQVSKANTIRLYNEETGKLKTTKKLFAFSSFSELRTIITNKLTYYFAYRAIAPKVIEHIFEGYAFHPAWKLTGAHWEIEAD